MLEILSRRFKRDYDYYTLTAFEHSTIRADGESTLYWYSFYVEKRTEDPLCPSIFVDIIKQTQPDVKVEPYHLNFLNPKEMPRGIEFYEVAAITARQIEKDIQAWQYQ